MEKEFLPYELALELKELGFNSSTSFLTEDSLDKYLNTLWRWSDGLSIIDNLIQAPLYQQAFKWFREKHKLLGLPKPYGYEIQYNASLHYWGTIVEEETNTYEEAELACLIKLIKIAKNK